MTKAIANYDSFSYEQLQSIVGVESETILDVGANDGGTSCVFHELFPNATIHSFEPDVRALTNFERRLKIANGKFRRIIIHRGAVADFDGQGTFYPSDGHNPRLNWYPTGWDLSGSLNRPLHNQHPGVDTITFSRNSTVKVTSLNKWASDHQIRKVDLLWMDVQGGELKVIKGATGVIPNTRYIFLECMSERIYDEQPTLDEIRQALSSHQLVCAFPDENYLFRQKE